MGSMWNKLRFNTIRLNQNEKNKLQSNRLNTIWYETLVLMISSTVKLRNLSIIQSIHEEIIKSYSVAQFRFFFFVSNGKLWPIIWWYFVPFISTLPFIYLFFVWTLTASMMKIIKKFIRCSSCMHINSSYNVQTILATEQFKLYLQGIFRLHAMLPTSKI